MVRAGMGSVRALLLAWVVCQCLLLALPLNCDAHADGKLPVVNLKAEPKPLEEPELSRAHFILAEAEPDEPEPADPSRPGPEVPGRLEDPPRPRPEEPGRPEDPPRPRPGEPGRPEDPPRPRPGEPGGPEDPPRPRPGEPGRPEDPPRPRPGEPGRPEDPPRPRPGRPEEPEDPPRPRPEEPPRPRPEDPPRPRPEEPGRPEDPPRPRPEEPPRPRPEEPPRPRPEDPAGPRPRPEEPPRPRPEEPPRPRPGDPAGPRPLPEEPPRPRPRPGDPAGPRPRPEEPPRPRPEEPPRPRPRPEDPPRPRPGRPEPPELLDPQQPQPEKRRLYEADDVQLKCKVSSSQIVAEEQRPKALTSRLHDFPQHFVFGTASAAYQYEGAASEGGRGPSVWDIWTHTEGNTYQGATGDVAVDQYHRYKEDVQLMKQMSVDAYRFSISWSRIYPSGRGEQVNQEGVNYYNNLINELLANKIQPFVTLYHWDLPQGLEDAYEGWLSPRIVDDFAAYAETCYKLFGDRVKHWITFNEPHTFVPYGYDNGVFPPGRCTPAFNSRCKKGNSSTETYRAAHNVLLSHAAAYRVYKDKYQKDQQGSVGITLDTTWFRPLTDSPADRDAAERALIFQVGWYLDPIVFGSYPEVMETVAGNRLPKFTEKEVKSLKGSYDFVGINHYTSQYAANGPSRPPGAPESYFSDASVQITAEQNGQLIGLRGASDWLYVVPDGMERVLLWVKDRYNNPPLYITENGYDDSASLSREQSLRDEIRTSYFKDYLSYVSRAIQRGVDLRGYFAWSLLDNLEWGNGFSVRFGLHYVDYEDDLRRYVKDSGLWFRKYLARQHQE